MSSSSPKIWSVIAPQWDAGKTTVASALVEILDSYGGAIGMKPRSNYRLPIYLDSFLESDRPNSTMVCGDANEINKFSSVFHKSEVELVAPIQIISDVHWSKSFLMRKGSAQIGKRKITLSDDAERFLLDKELMPEIRPFEGVDFKSAERRLIEWRKLSAEAEPYIEASFNYLCKKKPGHIVLEGAGGTIPIWRKKQTLENVVLILDFRIYVAEGANIVVSNPKHELVKFEHIAQALREIKFKTKKLPHVASSNRHSIAKDVLMHLLS